MVVRQGCSDQQKQRIHCSEDCADPGNAHVEGGK